MLRKQSLSLLRSHQDITWVLNVLLMVIILKLTSVLPPIGPIAMPNKLAIIFIITLASTMVKIFDSHASESSTPVYQGDYMDRIAAALDLLQGRLELRMMFQLLLTEDLQQDLRQLVMIQRAIIHVLTLVQGVAMDVMHIFVDWEAKWEQIQEDLHLQHLHEAVDKVVDARHRVDDGENFDFNGNLDS